MNSSEMIFGFDVVKFVIENYQHMTVKEISKHLKIRPGVICGIFEGLDITPIETRKDKISKDGRVNISEVKRTMRGAAPANLIEHLEYESKKVIMKTRCLTTPNRSSIQRPPTVYTNIDNSVYGVARELHKGKDFDTFDE